MALCLCLCFFTHRFKPIWISVNSCGKLIVRVNQRLGDTAGVCRGDNGQMQPNYSSIGGDLAASALQNAYYPQSNRGAGLVFGHFALDTAERAVSTLAQEFLFRRLTSNTK